MCFDLMVSSFLVPPFRFLTKFRVTEAEIACASWCRLIDTCARQWDPSDHTHTTLPFWQLGPVRIQPHSDHGSQHAQLGALRCP
jgi:hypothetical protein